MSYPPPPGTSLPPRPPPSIHASTHAFAGFKPRQVGSSTTQHHAPGTGAGGPPGVSSYGGVPGVSNNTGGGYGVSRPPAAATGAGGGGYGGYSAQQQASYASQPTMYSAAPTATGGGGGGAGGYMTSSGYQSQPQQSQQSYGQPPQTYSAAYTPNTHSNHHNADSRDHNGAGGGGTRGGRGGFRTFNNNNRNHHNNNSSYPPLDPEMEAQIAEQQSIYDPAKRAAMAAAANATTTGGNYDPNSSILPDGANAAIPGVSGQPEKKKQTVVRSGGGETWKDDTLLEWDPAHFRLFVGNIAGEVTDDSLLKAFSAYPSVQKARVIRDKRTTKSKGYGFVAFQDGDDYFRAAREMQGKYIGSHPVLLRKSTTEIRATNVGGKKKGKKGKDKNQGSGGNSGVLGKKDGGGVVKVKKEKGPKLLG